MAPMRTLRATGVSALVIGVCAAACASGKETGDDDPGTIDARVAIDAAGIDGADDVDAAAIDAAAIDAAAIDAAAIDAAAIDGAIIDGAVTDAATDAMAIDAPTVTDAACTPTTTQLLVNPAFDLTPVGTGWVETLINPTYPLITGDDGIAEHTAPYKAWMGGLVSGSDSLYQQVTVPAGTTSLVVRGQYEVRTAELAGSTVYDSGAVELTNAAGTVLETVLTASNLTPTTVWTAFQRTFTSPYAGQAVRLRFRSTNDVSDETSFYFDTIVLEATVGCP